MTDSTVSGRRRGNPSILGAEGTPAAGVLTALGVIAWLGAVCWQALLWCAVLTGLGMVVSLQKYEASQVRS
ncbi:hypothetical protein KKR91_07005 [Arthrobacter jiangjiafuii]|uniref:Uncharacterized protein n=1 Tax=Arthrobacter jiangjiafuii TaxID=2817475 RepID=A0A975M7C2_9MICC|nr:hypothetical protein [Arthrobacter jiangjiafuii]MBP3044353.1 hypothetical protein [Arthrobacter jiangjiafuii]QWC11305.1 hypothetical protein KKR91_07005 [Arthrobacter jiangjiafuii]